MKPKIKKTRVIRQLFAATLQRIGRRRHPKSVFEGPLHSVVILSRERFGDAIMLTPLIGTLRRRYPDLQIYVITFSQIVCDFFSTDPNITAVYHAKKNLKRYFREVLMKKFDLLFNSKNHPSTNFLIQTMLIRARFKAGIMNPYHVGLFDRLIEIDPHTHESAKNLSLLSILDSKTVQPTCRPYLPPMEVSAEVSAFLSSLENLACSGINISAGHSGGQRTLGQWSELIQNFPDEKFVIFSAPQDIDDKRKLERPHKNVIASPPTGNIFEVGEIVRKLKLLISPDTSLVHIAACSNTPVVGLYRATKADRAEFGPLSTLNEVVVSPTPDVIDIPPSEILTAVKKMLDTIQ